MANKVAAKESKVTPAKTSASKPKTQKKRISKGDTYLCEICGLQVIVDDYGQVMETQGLYCCEKPMKEKTGATKSAKK
jgi:hypothetical protein